MMDCFGYDQGTIKVIAHLGFDYLGMGCGNSASNRYSLGSYLTLQFVLFVAEGCSFELLTKVLKTIQLVFPFVGLVLG